MRALPAFAALCLLLIQAAGAAAQEPKPITLELAGLGKPAVTLTMEALNALPPVEQDVTFLSSKGEQRGHYKGVLLWDVLAANGLAELEGHNEALRHTLLVVAGDGYTMPFSVGEIAPEFGNTPVMLATEVDGKPYVEEGPRLVVPGDKRGARAVRDVVRIELR